MPGSSADPGTGPAEPAVLAQDGAENVTVDVAAPAFEVAGLVRALVDRDLTFRAIGPRAFLAAVQVQDAAAALDVLARLGLLEDADR
ncbi:MAG TPA: hypothetical protein VI248_15555 [Kineosporiaceae bacterium]